MNILITAGATRENIDRVRFISNFSSGNTATVITNFLKKYAKKTFFLHASYINPIKGVTNIGYTNFDSLKKQLVNTIHKNKINVVIHAAAVSDYKIDSIIVKNKKIKTSKSKLSSSGLRAINLKETPKLINLPTLKKPLLFAFKLTCTTNMQKRLLLINKIRKSPNVDILVHNDLTEIDKDKHLATIYTNKKLIKVRSKQELAKALLKVIKDLL